jgi:hypothetical protein
MALRLPQVTSIVVCGSSDAIAPTWTIGHKVETLHLYYSLDVQLARALADAKVQLITACVGRSPECSEPEQLFDILVSMNSVRTLVSVGCVLERVLYRLHELSTLTELLYGDIFCADENDVLWDNFAASLPLLPALKHLVLYDILEDEVHALNTSAGKVLAAVPFTRVLERLTLVNIHVDSDIDEPCDWFCCTLQAMVTAMPARPFEISVVGNKDSVSKCEQAMIDAVRSANSASVKVQFMKKKDLCFPGDVTYVQLFGPLGLVGGGNRYRS